MHKFSFMDALPADFREHRRAAKRERLLSWRSLLDAAIEQLDEAPAGAAGQGEAPGGSPAGQLPPEFWSHRRAAHRRSYWPSAASSMRASAGWRSPRRPSRQPGSISGDGCSGKRGRAFLRLLSIIVGPVPHV